MLLTFKNISLITEAEKDQALCENSPCIYGGKEQVDAEEHLLYFRCLWFRVETLGLLLLQEGDDLAHHGLLVSHENALSLMVCCLRMFLI